MDVYRAGASASPHMNWCSTDAWPDYKPCWQPVSTSLACPPALGFAYVFAQGRSLWCLLRICTPNAPILGYMIKVVYCGSTVCSTVAILWQWAKVWALVKFLHDPMCTPKLTHRRGAEMHGPVQAHNHSAPSLPLPLPPHPPRAAQPLGRLPLG